MKLKILAVLLSFLVSFGGVYFCSCSAGYLMDGEADYYDQIEREDRARDMEREIRMLQEDLEQQREEIDRDQLYRDGYDCDCDCW